MDNNSSVIEDNIRVITDDSIIITDNNSSVIEDNLRVIMENLKVIMENSNNSRVIEDNSKNSSKNSSIHVPDKPHITLNFLSQKHVHEPCVLITIVATKGIYVHIYKVKNECFITDGISLMKFITRRVIMDDLCEVICNFISQRIRPSVLDEFMVTTNFGYRQCIMTKANLLYVITPIIRGFLFIEHRSLIRDDDIRAEWDELERRAQIRRGKKLEKSQSLFGIIRRNAQRAFRRIMKKT